MKRLLVPGLATAMVTALAALSAPAGAATGHAAGHISTAAPRTTHASGSRAAAIRSAAHLVASRPPALEVSSHDRFHTVMVQSSHGLQYVAYDRTYRGLPVIGGDFVVATDSRGHILTTSVAQTRPVKLAGITARISRAQARATSKALLTHATLGATRLVVLQRTGSQLAWETLVSGLAKGEVSKLSVYVSARSGKVLTTKEHVADGTGTGGLNGPNPLSFGTTHTGSTYSMVDPNLTNTSCQNASGNTTFTGPDDVWGSGVRTDRETGCVDALFVADTEKAMLSAWDGRNGMDGNGGAWPIRIGLQDENAYYDGTQVQVGYNSAGQWIPSLDVLGHEMGHGVDDHTPGGISGKGTQEFVADTFGAATEWFANEPSPYDTPDFTVGETVNLVGNGPIRYMYNPSLAGDSNCYSSSTPNAEVHAAAGPGNHWFYLLAEGTNPTNGQPTSTTCNSTSITGVGIQTAEKVMYNAMLLKTTASSYLNYRIWTLQAAKNLTPGDCTLYNTVKAAWTGVSVPAQTSETTCTTAGNTVTVNNPGSQTGTVGTAKSVQITATDSAAGQTLTYSATGLPAGETINASSGLISGTPTTAGTYSVVVSAKDTTNATGSTSFTWTVNPAAGNTVTVTNPGSQSGTVGTAKSVQITATDSASGQTLTYSATGLPAGETINASSGLISGTPTTAGTYSVSVSVKDTTNATGSTSFTWTIAPAGGGTGCTSPGQKLGNPGFETGAAAPWTASTGVVSSTTSGQASNSGTYEAWMDGYGKAHTDTLTQSVAVPAGCTSYVFSFYVHIDTAETTTTKAYDTLTVKAGSTTLATYSNLNKATGYALKSFTLSGVAGTTVAISFSAVEDSSLQTSFVIDDTALTVS